MKLGTLFVVLPSKTLLQSQAPFYTNCGQWIPADLASLGRECQERFHGIDPETSTLEPTGAVQWPICEADVLDAGVNVACGTMIASGALSCATNFCEDCPGALAHSCDHTCGFSCLDGSTQFPPEQSYLMCFDSSCRALSMDYHALGVRVSEGTCAEGGALGSVCRLACRAGYEEANIVEGTCTLTGDGTNAVYSGQNITCLPEEDVNGQFSEAYCRMETADVILACCSGAAGCSETNPPAKCTVPCAERWQPHIESCENYLADYQILTASCDHTAIQFLGTAPSTLTVEGVQCHPLANGQYVLQQSTIGAKPYWIREVGDGSGEVYHFYSISVPHASWTIGETPVRF